MYNIKRLITVAAALLALAPFSSKAQDTLSARWTDAYLDTVQVYKPKELNNYSLLGVNYGVTFSQMYFNPALQQRWLFTPEYFSIMYTHHEKLFGYIPYFAFQIGLAYGHEGYRADENELPFASNGNGGSLYASQARISVVEVPVLMQLHFDASHFKIMGCAGVYGGYRLTVEREGSGVNDSNRNNFTSTDIRFDYGLEGGAGVGFIFDPVEIHFNALLRWGWSSLYEPDYYSKYYYRYAYPLDLMVTAGVHFQLTKRKGRTNAQIKAQARQIVEDRRNEN